MKNNFLKQTVMSCTLLIMAGTVSAHSQIGSLGKAVGATDLYQVSCFNDGSGTGVTSHLTGHVVTGVAPAGLKVSLRTQRLTKATNTTDTVNGDSVGSPYVKTVAGDGIYYMSVGKTASSAVAIPYTVDFHCENSAGGHTGTDWVMLQNQ